MIKLIKNTYARGGTTEGGVFIWRTSVGGGGVIHAHTVRSTAAQDMMRAMSMQPVSLGAGTRSTFRGGRVL